MEHIDLQTIMTREGEPFSEDLLFAVNLAHEAGTILLAAKGGEVTRKEGTSNVVTRGDIQADAYITKQINSKFPSDSVLSEEQKSTVENPLSVSRLWVADPCDGSTNFSRGKDEYYVAIALVKDGEPVLGVAYNPEKKKTYFAEKGKGAFLLRQTDDNLKPGQLHVSSRSDLKGALIETSMSYADEISDLHNLVKIQASNLNKAFRPSETGSSVGQLCWVAEGVSDGQYHFDLKPWDFAACQVIVQEAGGVMLGANGTSFNFTERFCVVGASLLLAHELLAVVSSLPENKALVSAVQDRVNNFSLKDFKEQK